MQRRIILLAAVALAVLLASGVTLTAEMGPAKAAFPGQNGRIAFQSFATGDSELFTVNPDGSGLAQLTRNTSEDEYPAWSPDGTKIAYVNWATDSLDEEVFVIPASGGMRTRLTFDRATARVPAWSPDGTKIAYMTIGLEGDWELVTIPAAGGVPSTVTDRASAWSPVWSPDGSKIAFWGDADGDPDTFQPFAIFTVNPDGTGETKVEGSVLSPALSEGLDWSPDGKSFVFSDDGDIYTIPATGGTPVQLTDTPDLWENRPSWSPDGTEIVYQTSRFGEGGLFRISATGGTPVPIPNTAEALYPDWQPLPAPPPERCTISGTNGSDILQGSPRNDVICAKGGHDAIDGRGGADILRGGSGSDAIRADAGDDKLYGGDGMDALLATDGVRGNDAMNGGGGTDACRGDRGDTKKGCEAS